MERELYVTRADCIMPSWNENDSSRLELYDPNQKSDLETGWFTYCVT